MCETHKALSSGAGRETPVPQIPEALKAKPPLNEAGDFQPQLPSAGGKVRKAIAPPANADVSSRKATEVRPEPKETKARRIPKPQPKQVPPEVAGESIDAWARAEARAMSRTMRIGLSRKETQKVAKAVTEVVGTHGVVSEIQAKALQVIREKISAIGSARTAAAVARPAPKAPAKARSTGTLHASNRPGASANIAKANRSRPQYGQYHRPPVTIEEPPKPEVTDAEMERRKRALAAHLAAQKAEEKPE